LSGATKIIQQSIFAACKEKKDISEWVSIKIRSGDYPVQWLQVPDDCKLRVFSGEGAKLIHIGKRRQPLFMLGKNSILKLENIEIAYKGKQRFLFRGLKKKPKNVILENVKITRIKTVHKGALVSTKIQPEESVSPKQLLDFLVKYISAYRKECSYLTGEPPEGAAYPPMLVNRAYVDSKRIRGYLLKDGILIADVVETKASKGYELDDSMERLLPKVKATLEDGTVIEVVKDKRSRQSFVRMITLGMFNLQRGPVPEYGKRGGLAKLTLRNDSLKKERYVSSIAWYPYRDRTGWHSKNAWIYAFYDIRYDIASAIATSEKAGQVYELGEGKEIVAVPTETIWREYDIKTKLGAKLAKFSKDIEEFKNLLEESESSKEKKFLDYLDKHTHLLDLYSIYIKPQPFLKIPNSKLSTVKGRGRLPDYIAKYRDDTYLLVEVERPSKPVFAGEDNRPSYQLTQAVNQVSVWDEIIRSFGNYLEEYPGLRNHRSIIVIGREHAQKFESPKKFREELNRVNQLYSGINVITFDDLVERAQIAVARIKALQSVLG